MTTEEYLSQIHRLDRTINNKIEDLDNLRVIAYGVKCRIDEERVQTSMKGDKIGAIATKIVEKEKEIDALVDKRYAIVKQIENMDDNLYYDMLFSKYVLCKSIKTISKEIAYSYRQTLRKFDEAMAFFEKKYGNTYAK